MKRYNNIKLKRSAKMTNMQTFLKLLSHLSSLKSILYSVHRFIASLFTSNVGLPTFTITQVFLPHPKMKSDLILPPFSDLLPVVFILLHQLLRFQHMSTESLLAEANNPPTLDGFAGPCRPCAVTQIYF